MALFADRRAAGRDLAAALAPWRGADAVVVGLPRGGVVVAAEVARVLGLPLTAVAVRKLGMPGREEYAVGAIAEGARVIDRAVADDLLAEVEERERVELERRAVLFAGGPPLAGATAIVVDDGIATGATATAACRAVRSRGAATIVLAAPVAPASWHPDADVADAYVCPHPQREFWAVGQFYDDFRQTSDAEVVELLRGPRAD